MIVLFVDTDIFLNYLLNRKNEFGKPLGPEAEEFFCKVLSSDITIIISTKVLEELYGKLKDPGKAQMLITMLIAKDPIF